MIGKQYGRNTREVKLAVSTVCSTTAGISPKETLPALHNSVEELQ